MLVKRFEFDVLFREGETKIEIRSFLVKVVIII